MPILLRDQIGMVLDVKGQCIPYNVCFVPYCIDFAGKTLLGTTVRRPLQIMNNSLAPVYFRSVYLSIHQLLKTANLFTYFPRHYFFHDIDRKYPSFSYSATTVFSPSQ